MMFLLQWIIYNHWRYDVRILCRKGYEECVQATVDELKEVNIGSIKDSTPIFINANLPLEEENAYTGFLKEFVDIFS